MADEINPFQAKKSSTTSGNIPVAPAPAAQPYQQPAQKPAPKPTIPPAKPAQNTLTTPTQIQVPAQIIPQIQQIPQLPSEPEPKKKHSWWFWVMIVIGGLIVLGVLAYFFVNSF
ncbi:hypothetical protein FJZ20_01060 [Candidatus Pacearchaeota archaeon]|nr:hypothetical protein [Candidatus Pacearchaeota archaeon]